MDLLTSNKTREFLIPSTKIEKNPNETNVAEEIGLEWIVGWIQHRKMELFFLDKETNYYLSLIRFSEISKKEHTRLLLNKFHQLSLKELPEIIQITKEVEKNLMTNKNGTEKWMRNQKESFERLQIQWLTFIEKFTEAKLKVLEEITRSYPVVIF